MDIVRRMIVLAAALPVVALTGCASAAGSPSPATQTANDTVHGGCAELSAKEKLPVWAGPAGGVVSAQVRLTGRTVEAGEQGVYSELEIDNRKLIAGRDPRVTAGWVAGGKNTAGMERPTRGPEGALWGPDGAAMLVINPNQTLDSNPDKVQLNIAPIVDDTVIFSGAGCWGFTELQTKPFAGQVSEVPGSETADAMRASMAACPYSDFASLAKKILGSP